MKKLGLPAYRFSISWSRLLPECRGRLSVEGLEFYNSLISELIANEITPMVTIHCWDLPECLDGGWLNPKIIEDFEYYAGCCFNLFGDRVKHWTTFNDPCGYASLGYCEGIIAPGRNEKPDTEPYLAAHHIILAHAKAVRRYREEFQPSQRGVIGIALTVDWREPISDEPGDRAAARRAMDWQLAWFADPIWKGDYPESMKRQCGRRLPAFSEEEKAMVRGSSDFCGLNHYSTAYAAAVEAAPAPCSYWSDQAVRLEYDASALRTDSEFAVVPWGLKRVCEHIHKEYSPSCGIIVTENGCAVKDEDVQTATQDSFRVNYYHDYIVQLHEAIMGGTDVRGYFAWSLMDCFEWVEGYTKRFGLCHVDYTTQVRTPKASARFLSELARANALRTTQDELRGRVGRPEFSECTQLARGDVEAAGRQDAAAPGGGDTEEEPLAASRPEHELLCQCAQKVVQRLSLKHPSPQKVRAFLAQTVSHAEEMVRQLPRGREAAPQPGLCRQFSANCWIIWMLVEQMVLLG
ncbi:unnamed protein product [Prorocentrum cordatum]|uniref:Beta-glucosidase n=1 Tax=Prorocentrum cordatum TaxID=2364126 RepID=A0ABN9TTQ5_9DINO|nr:unnamed protein product [Polarella glacialis]